MRQAFVKTLEQLAAKDKKVLLLTADLGFTVFENFKDKFSEQFFNLGVAESNMIGTAAGLALSGYTPVAYSIATFAALRPFEFIRNDVCYHNANVKIVGVGGGLGYGSAGFSHCNYEDVAVLRTLPNLTILSPADPLETAVLTELAIKHKGPVYLRLGKVGESAIHQNKPKLKIGQGYIIKPGKKAAIISTGPISANVLKALPFLKFNPTVAIMPTLKPLDETLIKQIAQRHSYIFTVEEHSIIGGLGSAVAEVISGSGVRLKCLGIAKTNYATSGSQAWLRNRHGLSPKKFAEIINSL